VRTLIRRFAPPLIAVMMVLSGARLAVAGEIIDRVLAVAAGTLIMLSDVQAAQVLHLVDVPAGADPVAAILPRLIDRALMLSEVERYAPPEPPEDQVARRLDEIRGFFPSSSAFAEALARVGMDERHLRETVRQDIRILAYVDQRFAVPPPTDSDIERYYREHQGRFVRNGRTMPLEEARSQIAEAAAGERRQQLIDEWVSALRRRTEVLDLSVSATTR
jgi:hypothetical protein